MQVHSFCGKCEFSIKCTQAKPVCRLCTLSFLLSLLLHVTSVPSLRVLTFVVVVGRTSCIECAVQSGGGRLKRSARAVQLFGRLAVLETHTLRY